MTEELKPCPFCGGIARVVNTFDEDYPKAVECDDCYAATPDRETEQLAIEFWNKRA